ncbi:MAG: cyclic-di-AMP receptor [Chloroflexia bacterium]
MRAEMSEPRLIIAIVQRRDLDGLSEALLSAGFSFTHVASVGGFLMEANDTLFIAVDRAAVDTVLRIIRQHCHTRTRYLSPISPLLEMGGLFPPAPVEIQVGGAHVFVLPVEATQHLQ